MHVRCPMFHRVLTVVLASLFTASLMGEETPAAEENKSETASVGEQKKAVENEDKTNKRKWVKKNKPGAPKARRSTPGKKVRAIGPSGEIGMEDEELEEAELPFEEGNPGQRGELEPISAS